MARTKVKVWRDRYLVGRIKMSELDWKYPYVADTDSITSSELFDN